MSIDVTWSHSTLDIPHGGLDSHRTATVAERTQLAAALELLSLERLEVRYRIVRRAGGRFHLTGRLHASVVQECGITLEPVPAEIDEELDLEFWPGESRPEPEPGEHEALALDEIEPIENERLAVGRVVFETLASTLDPYPRAQGAEFRWQDNTTERTSTSNPFAALARWKQKTG
jgi:uncharacterized metal-binding protein YceD (DUF177 family)